jgi:hypothetical protein
LEVDDGAGVGIEAADPVRLLSTATVASGRISNKHNPTLSFVKRPSWIRFVQLIRAVARDAAIERPERVNL